MEISQFEKRSLQLFNNRYQANLLHLSQFVRLQINLSSSLLLESSSFGASTAADPASLSASMSAAAAASNFPQQDLFKTTVVIDRQKSIQDLARLVEAEYAFANSLKSAADGAAADNRSILIPCISVVMIYDVALVPLKFSSSIAEVLNNGDSIRIVAVVIQDNLTMRDLLSTRVGLYTRLHSFLTGVCSETSPPDSFDTSVKLSEHLVKNDDLNILALLHNMDGIAAFQEFCMQDYEIETLLFWLEIEVFRGLAHVSSPAGSDHVEMSNPKYAFLLLHARYIYYTFLAKESSLRINIPSDLMASFDWPLPMLDPVTGWHLPLRIAMWDDVQEHVFSYLSRYVYPKFTNSHLSQSWHKTLQTPVSDLIKIAGDEESAWFMMGEHYKRFQQDIEGMEKAVGEALSGSGEAGVSFQNNAQTNLGFRQGRIQSKASIHSVGLHPPTVAAAHISGNRLEPANVETNLLAPMPAAFYGQGPKITNAQKFRRIQREKKLKKFFGDKPFQEDAYADAQSNQFGSVENDGSETDESLLSAQVRTTDTLLSPTSPVQTIEPDEAQYKLKKVDKLNGFFGVNKLPPELMFEQRVIDRLENIYVNELPAPSTVNELPEESKRKLVQRNKKLRGLLGQFDESALVTPEPMFGAAPPLTHAVRRLSTMSVDSTDSGSSSLAQLSDRAKRLRDEKLYKRKKLEKIRQFLGEKVSSSDMEAPKPLTQKERQMATRRLQKLQSVFGETPPSAMMLKNRTVMKLLEMVGGEAVKYVLGHEDDLRELLDVMEEFDRSQGKSMAEIVMTEEDASSGGAVEEGAEGDDEFDSGTDGKQAARQRKRIGKLTKFFGSTAGNVSNNMTTEDKVIEDLGRHLRNVMDPDVLKSQEKLSTGATTADGVGAAADEPPAAGTKFSVGGFGAAVGVKEKDASEAAVTVEVKKSSPA